ncbi:LysR family transcriptional regulator [Variovorax sp. KK3]|uniref:LysR family transcriptional regulator n=1 Tax=Variovorax sp. KK3 TaxID=1855728 RepID=UPI00097C126F|nr:LysR family transcriptional regulator [Variovorax sp. KK3]
MKIEAFQTLDAVVRGGSFAAAAQAMHLTPSAVSMQMKQLEQYLGRPLFDRSGQQVRVTPAALELVGTMRPALDALQTLRHRTPTSVAGHLKIGMIEMLQPLLLPPAIAHTRRVYPGLHIALRRGTSMELTEAVRAGQLDAAMVARPASGAPSGLEWTPLIRCELVFIAPPLDEPARARPLTAARQRAQLVELMRSLDWIRYNRATTTGAMATRFVRGMVPQKRSLMELEGAAAIVAMVHAGLGFSVLQVLNRALFEQYPVRVIGLGKDAPHFDMCIVRRSGDVNDRLHQAWNEALRAALVEAKLAIQPVATPAATAGFP